MSTGAIIMMIIGCGGLWGGFTLACIIAVRCAKRGAKKNDIDKTAVKEQQ